MEFFKKFEGWRHSFYNWNLPKKHKNSFLQEISLYFFSTSIVSFVFSPHQLKFLNTPSPIVLITVTTITTTFSSKWLSIHYFIFQFVKSMANTKDANNCKWQYIFVWKTWLLNVCGEHKLLHVMVSACVCVCVPFIGISSV